VVVVADGLGAAVVVVVAGAAEVVADGLGAAVVVVCAGAEVVGAGLGLQPKMTRLLITTSAIITKSNFLLTFPPYNIF